jgi:hypothetical protein
MAGFNRYILRLITPRAERRLVLTDLLKNDESRSKSYTWTRPIVSTSDVKINWAADSEGFLEVHCCVDVMGLMDTRNGLSHGPYTLMSVRFAD